MRTRRTRVVLGSPGATGIRRALPRTVQLPGIEVSDLTSISSGNTSRSLAGGTIFATSEAIRSA